MIFRYVHPKRTYTVRPTNDFMERYIIENSVIDDEGNILERRCSKCGDMYPVAHYYMRRTGILFRCRRCNAEDQMEYGHKRDPLRGSRRCSEIHITRKDMALGITCEKCGIWQPLTEFKRVYYRAGTKGKYLSRICLQCRNIASQRPRLLRRARALLGEHSPEYHALENEKRYHYFKAMCWMYGVVRYNGFLASTKHRALRRVLPGMQLGSTEWEEKREEAVQIVQKNHGRKFALSMQQVRGV